MSINRGPGTFSGVGKQTQFLLCWNLQSSQRKEMLNKEIQSQVDKGC